MKATMLKIAGVKDEKSFYKKFPDEASFMKTHGKEFKKALLGERIKAGNGVQTMADAQSGQFASQNIMNIPGTGAMSKINPYIQPLSNVFAGISMIGSQKQKVRQANQMAQLTDIQADAAESRDIDFNRMNDQLRVRPEDMLTPSYRAYGEGTNPLARYGKEIPKAFLGINKGSVTNFMDQGGANLVDSVTGMVTNNKYGQSAGSSIGKGAGAILGTALFGPLGGILGGGFGKVVGDLFDNSAEKIERYENIANKNRQRAQGQLFAQGIQQQNQSYMEQGGNLTNPQVITKFGEHTMRELLAPDRTMDTLRTGGHLRQNVMDEDLQMYDGGAKPISYNPFLPEGGETVEFRGPSHEEGGMNVAYGKNPVEVEGGEPAVKMQNGGGASDLVVFGNLNIPKGTLNDPKAKGKFKSYIKDISRQEEHKNKVVDKSVKGLEDLDVITPFDKLTLASYRANLIGANASLKELAEKKKDAAIVQQALNETSEEYGIDADALSRGKIKQAKKGATIEKAQDGKGMLRAPLIYRNEPVPFNTEAMRQAYLRTLPQAPVVPVSKVESYVAPPVVSPAIPTKGNKSAKERKAEEVIQAMSPITEATVASSKAAPISNDLAPIPNYNSMYSSEQREENEYPWIPIANEAARWFRPRYRIEQPDLTAEKMMAAGMNQLEPVQAQRYQPLLPGEPPSISMQDQLNEITAQTRQAQRNPAVAGNPAAQAIIAAQAYGPKSSVLANQFRTNQELREKYRMQNLETLNDAQLKNLGISDQQFVRQAQAKSNTKQAALEIAKSMSDKIARAKQEQTLADLERWRYNYVFGPGGVPINWNGIAQFNTSGSGATPYSNPSIIESGGKRYRATDYDNKTGQPTKFELVGKNGIKIKSSNGSLVRDLKKS